LTEKYGGDVVASPAGIFQAPVPAPADVRATGTRPLEVEDLGAGEMLDEIEELPVTEAGGMPGADAHSHKGNSVVEVPVVLDRSLFTGEAPVEIRLKLYLK